MNAIARYLGGLQEAWQESGVFGWLLVGVWMLYPVAVVTAYHPGDAVGFQAWLQGLAIPDFASNRMLVTGEVVALLSLAALSLFQFGVIVLIYRRAQFFVQLWPLGAVLLGVIGNGVWWMWKGYFDPFGALAGLTPVVAAVVCQGVCEQLGANFVFGPGAKPQYEPGF